MWDGLGMEREEGDQKNQNGPKNELGMRVNVIVCSKKSANHRRKSRSDPS